MAAPREVKLETKLTNLHRFYAQILQWKGKIWTVICCQTIRYCRRLFLRCNSMYFTVFLTRYTRCTEYRYAPLLDTVTQTVRLQKFNQLWEDLQVSVPGDCGDVEFEKPSLLQMRFLLERMMNGSLFPFHGKWPLKIFIDYILCKNELSHPISMGLFLHRMGPIKECYSDKGRAAQSGLSLYFDHSNQLPLHLPREHYPSAR